MNPAAEKVRDRGFARSARETSRGPDWRDEVESPSHVQDEVSRRELGLLRSGPRPPRRRDRLAVPDGHRQLGVPSRNPIGVVMASDRVGSATPRRGVVARIVTGPHDTNPQGPHLPMLYDAGRPRSVIRFRISQPRTASLPCPAGLRARRSSPMIDLYRKNVFSTRA